MKSIVLFAICLVSGMFLYAMLAVKVPHIMQTVFNIDRYLVTWYHLLCLGTAATLTYALRKK